MNLNECQLNFVNLLTMSSFLKNGDKGMLSKLTSLVLYFGDFFDKICAEKIIYDEEKRLRVKWYRKIDVVPLSSAFRVPPTGVTKLWLHELNKEEYQNLVELLNSGLFPNFTELGISMWKYVNLHKNVQVPVDKLVQQGVHWVTFQAYGFTERLPPVNVLTLKRLALQRVIRAEEHLIVLSRSIALINLHKLVISHSSCITGNLTTLLCHSPPSLNSLILSDCELNAQDLCSLAQASVVGKLPQLKHLDISVNSHLHGQLNQLFVEGCKWQQLQSLNVESSSTRSFQFMKLRVKSGCLNSLKELRFTTEEDISEHRDVKWPCLNTLHVCLNRYPSQMTVTAMSKLVAEGAFPVLRLLHVNAVQLSADSLIRSLTDQFTKSFLEIVDNKVTTEVLNATTSALSPFDTMFHGQHSHTFGYCELSDMSEYDAQILAATSKVATDIVDNLETYKPEAEDQTLLSIIRDRFVSLAPYVTRHRPGQKVKNEGVLNYYAARNQLTLKDIVICENVVDDFEIGW